MIEEIIISALVLGGQYALLAMGFSLIQGVARVMNLAHGGLYILTAYFIITMLPIGLGPAIIISLIFIVLTSFIIYKLLIGPMREKEIRAAIVTLALVLIMQESMKLIWGPEFQSIPYVITGYVTILGVRVVSQKLLALIVSVTTLIILMIFIRWTKPGKAIRAVAQNMEVARLVGIDVSKVMIMSLGISALLAGFAAFLFAPVYIVSPVEWTILFRAFPVIVLGGMGSLKGSLIASFVLAGVEKVVEFAIGGGYIVQTVTFAIMLIIIFVRPTGLFGHKTTGRNDYG